MLAYLIVDTIYWILQPNVLIYQCDEGIVIKRNIEIEYKSIEKIYCKNELSINHRRNYYRDPAIGTIFIKLKSGKIYKIRNVICFGHTRTFFSLAMKMADILLYKQDDKHYNNNRL